MCNRLPEIKKNGDAGIFPVYYSLKYGMFLRTVRQRLHFLKLKDGLQLSDQFIFKLCPLIRLKSFGRKNHGEHKINEGLSYCRH